MGPEQFSPHLSCSCQSMTGKSNETESDVQFWWDVYWILASGQQIGSAKRKNSSYIKEKNIHFEIPNQCLHYRILPSLTADLFVLTHIWNLKRLVGENDFSFFSVSIKFKSLNHSLCIFCDKRENGKAESYSAILSIVSLKIKAEKNHWDYLFQSSGFPGGSADRIHLPSRRCHWLGFNPWVGKIPLSRKWQSTPVFLPGEFHGHRRLVDYSPWAAKSWTQLKLLSTDIHIPTF